MTEDSFAYEGYLPPEDSYTDIPDDYAVPEEQFPAGDDVYGYYEETSVIPEPEYYYEAPDYYDTPAEVIPAEENPMAYYPAASSSDLVPVFTPSPDLSSPSEVMAVTPDRAELKIEEVAEDDPEETPRLFLDTPFQEYSVSEGLLLSLLILSLVSALIRIVKEGFSWL